MSKICPICSKIKPNKQFVYGALKIEESKVCKHCMNLLSVRLTAITEFDKQLCQELKINYWSVTDYEQSMRKLGLYREHFNVDEDIRKMAQDYIDKQKEEDGDNSQAV